MHAVIVTGGKQYRIKEGDKLKIETLTAPEGDEVVFDKVMLVSDGESIKVGKPYIEGGKVTATVTEHGRHKKIKVLKFKRRKGYMRTQGHRQNYTEVLVNSITAA